MHRFEFVPASACMHQPFPVGRTYRYVQDSHVKFSNKGKADIYMSKSSDPLQSFQYCNPKASRAFGGREGESGAQASHSPSCSILNMDRFPQKNRAPQAPLKASKYPGTCVALMM